MPSPRPMVWQALHLHQPRRLQRALVLAAGVDDVDRDGLAREEIVVEMNDGPVLRDQRHVRKIVRADYALSNVQMPIAMKPAPARIRRCPGVTHTPSRSPISTARSVDAVSAAVAAMKTPNLLVAGSLANSNVASCVLSPSSARKTFAKITR